MVACVSETSAKTTDKQISSTSTRPPLMHNGTVTRRPKARHVSSRYLSPSPSTSTTTTTLTSSSSSSCSSSSSSRRFSSPLPQRRSQSADRSRRFEGNVGEISDEKECLITSTRSLSVSFQGESFSLPVSKAKRSVSNVRERRGRVRGSGGDQVENFRPGEHQHRWPARTRISSLSDNSSNALLRSLDYAKEIKRLGGFGSEVAAQVLEKAMRDESRRVSCDGRLSLDLGNEEMLMRVGSTGDANLGNEYSVPSDVTVSDSDSVSSGSNSGMQEFASGGGKPKSVPRGIVVPARFWQETNNRLRRLQDPGSPLPSSPGSRAPGSAKLKRFSSDNVLSSLRAMASPLRGSARPASPSKSRESTGLSTRGSPSPSRVRSYIAGLFSGNSAESPSILSYSVDMRRKVGEDRIADAHMLRLLYNQYLQWRVVNARADAVQRFQILDAEENLWNAWATISELRHSVMIKRIKSLLLRQKLKLASILKEQMAYMEEWALLEKDHCNSLEGATEALKASTLRLPLFEKAVADIDKLKEAIGSAFDVMQAAACSICSLSSKVEEINTLMAEVVGVTIKEQLLLNQCKDLFSKLTTMQVKDSSLRTHIIQLNH